VRSEYEVAPAQSGSVRARSHARRIGRSKMRATTYGFMSLLGLVLASTLGGASPDGPQLTPDTAFQQYARAVGLSESMVAERLKAFRALPSNVQANAASILTDRVAVLSAAHKPVKLDPNPLGLDDFTPPYAGQGDWVYIFGWGFTKSSVVVLDGQPQTTILLLTSVPGETVVAFQVPSTAKLYAKPLLLVQDGSRKTEAKQFPIVAPRGYRGLHGWRFQNKGGPTIPWEIYRNYFGKDNVEFSDGTHKPKAQYWYDSRYKGIGNGGNCYGMAMSSVRVRLRKTAGLLHSAWWDANRKYVWDYPSDQNSDPVWQTIQEMQGSQLGEPQHTMTWNTVSASRGRDAWTAGHIYGWASTIMVMANWQYGHATDVYGAGPDTESPRRVFHYDNNTPYALYETGGPDRSVATVAWGSGSFSYGGYNEVAVFYYTALLPSNAHLPSVAGGSSGANVANAAPDAGSAYLWVPGVASVTQVTDESGRTLLLNGQTNTGPTAIPGAIFTPPMMGGPPPRDYPRSWLFADSTGKKLTVDVSGAQGGDVAFMQQGVVTTMTAGGAALHFSVTGVNTANHRLAITNPGAAKLDKIKMIASPSATEERTFEISQFGTDLDDAVEVALSADHSELQVTNRTNRPAALKVMLRTDGSGSHVATKAMTLNLAAVETGVLKPGNWRNLRGQDVQLELRTLQGTRKAIRSLKP
jgi:hypothetical protein